VSDWGQTQKTVTLVAAGKASVAMSRAAVRVLGPRLAGGLVIAPGDDVVPAPLELIVGDHPVPSADSERAGRRALALARDHEGDALLVLLSGGASALMAVPADGLTIADKQQVTAGLLRAGAGIHALNTVRKHLSAIKGGRLAAASATPFLALALSDVVDDDLSVIASGPTVPDPSTFADALRVLEQHGGTDVYPRTAVDHLRRGVEGHVAETPKPGDARLGRGRTSVIGSRHDAMKGAQGAAEALGYRVMSVASPITGESRIAALRHWDDVVVPATRERGPICVISSGETTVHVTGDGTGGRNQEFALALVDRVAACPAVALASVGTDGIDGTTTAAGAIVDSTSRARAVADRLPPPDRFLERNNSHAFFDALGDLINTGPTGTNVGDLQIILLA